MTFNFPVLQPFHISLMLCSMERLPCSSLVYVGCSLSPSVSLYQALRKKIFLLGFVIYALRMHNFPDGSILSSDPGLVTHGSSHSDKLDEIKAFEVEVQNEVVSLN